jgi:ligand-binding SRPBCC domain-containing protein
MHVATLALAIDLIDVRFSYETRIAAPPSAVFAFHERPDALELLVPPWEPVEVVQPPASLQAGTRVILRMHAGPLKFTWIAEHTRYEPGVLFQDKMVRGPFRKWLHTHHMLPTPDGATLLRDELELELPFWMLPGLPIVKRRLRRMFAYRHQVTARELLRSGNAVPDM